MSSSAETLFLDWVNRCMARNQRVSASLVASKIVPLMSVLWWRCALHCFGSHSSDTRNLWPQPTKVGGAPRRRPVGVERVPAAMPGRHHAE